MPVRVPHSDNKVNTALNLKPYCIILYCNSIISHRITLLSIISVSYCITLYPYHIVSYPIISYRIELNRITYRMVSYRIKLYSIVSYRISPHLIVMYHILLSHITSYRIIVPHSIVSYQTASYCIILYRFASYQVLLPPTSCLCYSPPLTSERLSAHQHISARKHKTQQSVAQIAPPLTVPLSRLRPYLVSLAWRITWTINLARTERDRTTCWHFSALI